MSSTIPSSRPCSSQTKSKTSEVCVCVAARKTFSAGTVGSRLARCARTACCSSWETMARSQETRMAQSGSP
ncbi:MAG: hypothetical protein AB1505_19850 [Candidatus Latescibacterota bacterium]